MPNPHPGFLQPSDVNGLPLAGAKLYFYAVGTTTELSIFSTEAGTPLAQPVVADASGIFQPVFLNEKRYKTLLTTSAGVTVQTVEINNPGSSNWVLDNSGILLTTGTASALVVDPYQDYSTLAEGDSLRFRASVSCNGSATLNAGGGAVAFRVVGSAGTLAAISASMIRAGAVYDVTYNGSNWVLLNPSVPPMVQTSVDNTVPRFNGTSGAMQTSGVTIDDSDELIASGGLRATASGAELTGNGISFPATAVPSSGANVLDDYEEGTWTPAVEGTTAAGVGTYSVQDGFYIKIGRAVFFSGSMVWSAHTGTGNMIVSGLPFVATSGTLNYPVAVSFSTMTLANPFYGFVAQGANGTITLGTAALAAGAYTALLIDVAATMNVSGWYLTESS